MLADCLTKPLGPQANLRVLNSILTDVGFREGVLVKRTRTDRELTQGDRNTHDPDELSEETDSNTTQRKQETQPHEECDSEIDVE